MVKTMLDTIETLVTSIFIGALSPFIDPGKQYSETRGKVLNAFAGGDGVMTTVWLKGCVGYLGKTS